MVISEQGSTVPEEMTNGKVNLPCEQKVGIMSCHNIIENLIHSFEAPQVLVRYTRDNSNVTFIPSLPRVEIGIPQTISLDEDEQMRNWTLLILRRLIYYCYMGMFKEWARYCGLYCTYYSIARPYINIIV